MKVDNETRAKVFDYMRESQQPTMQGVAEILREMTEQPDPAELIEQAYNMTARRYWSMWRKGDGERRAYAAGITSVDGEITDLVYIDIDECTDEARLTTLLRKVKKMQKHYGRLARRVTKRLKAIAGQMSIFDGDELRKAE